MDALLCDMGMQRMMDALLTALAGCDECAALVVGFVDVMDALLLWGGLRGVMDAMDVLLLFGNLQCVMDMLLL